MIDFVAGGILGAAAVVAAFFVRGGFVKAGECLKMLREKRSLDSECEETFRSFFEQHCVGFAVTDEKGRWLKVNDRLCEILGYGREELEQLTWFELTPPGILDAEKTTFEELLSPSSPDEGSEEKQYIRKDGSPIDVLVTARILGRSENGGVRLASTVQDISDRKRLVDDLQKKAAELERHREAIITSMAVLSEFRDGGTGEHIRRTREYVLLMLERAEAERYYPFSDFGLIGSCAVLHDIGKVSIPDRILLKPGPLTPEEFDIIRTHPIIGSYVLGKAENILEGAGFLKYAREIVAYHHEKWDGTGYPFRIAGEEIPFTARIMAVADVYDALVSERPYKKAFPHEKAVEIIASESGKHFDPQLVKVFLECADEFRDISKK